jgi:hypothetical protein
MLPSEIIEGETYTNRCGWRLRVDRVSLAFSTCQYVAVSGPMVGRGGDTNLDEFAERVVSRVRHPKERLAITEPEQ